MESKICSKCNELKFLCEFYKIPKKDTYRSICKNCHNNKSKIYYLDNKDNITEYKKKWRNDNLNYILKSDQDKRDSLTEEEKLIIKEYNKIWWDNNKDSQKKKKRKYYLDNKEYILSNAKKYRSNNSEKIKEYQDKYKHIKNKKRLERLKNDTLYALEKSIRNNIYDIFKRNGYTKKSKTSEILGCSFEELKKYLESKFENWMTWENRGLYNGELNYGWDIDHIIPLSSAKTEDDIIRLNHYSNLQPLCSYTNRYIKRNIF